MFMYTLCLFLLSLSRALLIRLQPRDCVHHKNAFRDNFHKSSPTQVPVPGEFNPCAPQVATLPTALQTQAIGVLTLTFRLVVGLVINHSF